MEKYKLNDSLIFREEDCTFFSLDSMEIYEMNDVVMEMVALLKDKTVTSDEFKHLYNSISNVDLSVADEFLAQLIELRILIKEDNA